MKYSASHRHVLIYCISVMILFAICATCCALIINPQPGTRTKTDGNMTIDYSNMNQGYVLIKCTAREETEKADKVQVSKGNNKIHYDMNFNGDYEIIPLQYGNGKYTFQFYKHKQAKTYALEAEISLKVKMSDENAAFLCPNQYVNFTEDTEAVKKADELCKDLTDHNKIYKTIRKFIITNFHYDYIKSYNVKKGQLPDIDDAWNKKMGICQDLSAIAVAMLRSQGVPAKLVIGNFKGQTGTTPHAWVSVILDGKEQRFDPVADIQHVKGTYTVNRWY